MSLNYLYDDNINKHIYFLTEQIKTFRKENTDELKYQVAMKLENYLKNNDLNSSLMKVFQSFIPADEVSSFSLMKIRSLTEAMHRVRVRYEHNAQ